ncbi:MAG: gamma-glutamyltransferase [Deltaproteobacteria bacterium]|nr:gamma-glutamyltransferase [Deltaproteobacteria bacterium]
MTASITRDGRARQARAARALAPALVAAAVGCTVAALPAPKAQPPKKTLAPEAVGARYAVATENGEASRIALEVLRSGGDAVDAAAAAALALGVATPTACGIGGGGFAVVWRAKTKEAFVVDFREVGPSDIDASALDRRPLPPSERGHTVGVPGEIAGLSLLVTKFGKKAWRDDVLPAVKLAREGFLMTPHVARGTQTAETELRALAPALGVRLLAAAGPLPAGTRVLRADLAKTLQTIADHGPRAFYVGSIARAMVEAAKSVGGTMTMEDLAAYQPKLRQPIRVALGAREVITMPPPSAGGVMLGQTVQAHKMLALAWGGAGGGAKGKGLDMAPWGSAETTHLMAELMRGSLDDRARFIGDPDATPVDVGALLSEARMIARLKKIDPWSSKPPVELRVDEHGTSHLSIVDAEGNAVALTTTVNSGFGAKLVAGDTGIVLNDQLDDFGKTIDAIGGHPNVPRAKARPTSSMTPTIVIENGLPVMVAGGSGGMRIASSVTLVSIAHLVFGLSPGDAVGWPRVHPMGGKLSVEPTLSPTVVAELIKRGETVTSAEAVNAVQLVAVQRTGGTVRLVAAADPRKGGVALAE